MSGTHKHGGFRWWDAPLALVLAALVALGAHALFDATRDTASPEPTARDLTARVDRVAAGLRRSPLYADPESGAAAKLGADRYRALLERLRGFEVPVYVALVRSDTDDESAGEQTYFLHLLHKSLRRDGVYVTLDSGRFDGPLDVVGFGVRRDIDTLDLPDSVVYGSPGDEQDNGRMDERLDAVLDAIAKAPADGPATPGPPPAVDDPYTEHDLPGLFSGDFAPGLFVGALGAGLLFGLVVLVLRGVRAVLRRRASGRPSAVPRPRSAVPAQAPQRPTTGYLRRTARSELDALGEELDAMEVPDDVRARAWDCLDAATLLVDGDGDNRIDAAATPAALAAAIALGRAGRTTLESRDAHAADRLCAVNPLHGAASAGRGRRLAPGAPRKPVCAGCRAALASGARAGERVLVLPAPAGGRGRGPYHAMAGPLAAGTLTDRLIRDAKESAGVD